MPKTAKERKWRRGRVEVKCEYCKDTFFQQMPTQKYCCNSHRVLAWNERKRNELPTL